MFGASWSLLAQSLSATSFVRCRMHLVTGDAGKISAFETGRLLHAVDLPPGHSNHAVAPEAVVKKIRLRLRMKSFCAE